MKKGLPNRIVKLSYGNGCQFHDNCFDCPVAPDCKCTCRDGERKRTEFINVGKIFVEGVNYGQPATDGPTYKHCANLVIR